MDERDSIVKEAWGRYLEGTRHLQGANYEEVEPWAWKKLLTALKAKPREKVTNGS